MSSSETPTSTKPTSARNHRWKQSWPGNFCLDCGYDDPFENTDESLVNCTECNGSGTDFTYGGPFDCGSCSGTGCVPNPNLKVEPCPGPPTVLFVDFDGVLHPLYSGALPTFEGTKRLREILRKYPRVLVVVHSSWRMVQQYTEKDIGDFLELEEDLQDRYLGVTPISEPSRWESIQAWMKQRNFTGPYVILDDMRTSFDYEGQDHLICPRYDVGMQEEDWKELERRLDANLQP